NGGTADGLLIADNTFDPGYGGVCTTAAMNLASTNGAARWTIFHNRGGCDGGAVVVTGTLQPNIIYNQFEQNTGTGSASNGAMIDLQGTGFPIDGAEIIGNNLNAYTGLHPPAGASINIRLDHATNAHIEGNVITIKPVTSDSRPAGIGISS